MPVAVALRPEKIAIAPEPPQGSAGMARRKRAAGVVSEVGYLGATSLNMVRLDNGLV
jgi:hypothetical protein